MFYKTSSLIQSTEERNFFRRLTRPACFIRYTPFILKELGKSFAKKNLKFLIRKDTVTTRKPPYLFTPHNKNKIKKGSKSTSLQNLPKLEWYPKEHTNNLPTKICLATKELAINDTPQWNMIFDDREDTFALHRWGWLLHHLVQNPTNALPSWGLRIMQNWFQTMGKQYDHPAWESYSVSERIVNGIIFLSATHNYLPLQKDNIISLTNHFYSMGTYLTKHLEYYGEERTNNHFLNNARALYFLGRILNDSYFMEISSQILLRETLQMFTPSGFLREGSSHYHFLMTRSFLEILWIAEITNDKHMIEALENIVKKMVKRACFFLVQAEKTQDWTLLLMGDISPDFTPNWLIGLPWSKLALKYQPFDKPEKFTITAKPNGWSNLWGENYKLNQIQERVTNYQKDKHFAAFPESGWYRLDWGNLTIFWHVEPKGTRPLRSHGHNDIGSFCLFYKGTPVFIDPGRMNYQQNLIGRYGRSAFAHNSILIDDLDPFVINRRNFYHPSYIEGNSWVEWENNDNSLMLKISHSGFSRIGKKIIASRFFICSNDEIMIKDQIMGSGKHRFKTLFHFGPDIKIEKCKDEEFTWTTILPEKNAQLDLKIEINDAADTPSQINFLCGQQKPFPIGWYFPRYGEKIPTTTMVLENTAKLPYTMNYKIITKN